MTERKCDSWSIAKLVLFSMLLLFVWGCSDEERFVEVRIDSETGGVVTVELSHNPEILGAQVEVPPRALDAEATISIVPSGEIDSAFVGPVVHFRPTGLRFDQPVRVRVPFDELAVMRLGSEESSVRIVRILSSGDLQELSDIVVDTSGNFVSGDTAQLGRFVATLVDGSDAGGNIPPIAMAGNDQSVTVGTLVSLDGTGSADTDGDALSYSWVIFTQPSESLASIQNSDSVAPSFTVGVDGEYVIRLTVNDGFTDSAADEVRVFATNSQLPGLVITSPPDGVALTSDSVQVSGTVSASVAEVLINDVAVPIIAGQFSANVALEVGDNTIVVVASDVDGNSNNSSVRVTRGVGADSTPPLITISSPTDGGTTSSRRPTVVVNYSDDSALNIDTLTVAVGGQVMTCTAGDATAECRSSADLGLGSFEITATIADTVGNVGEALSVFQVTNLPVVTIYEPANRTITRDSTITVSGTISVPPDRVTINGVLASVTDSAFTAQVPLREGDNMVTVTVTGDGGFVASNTVAVTRDVIAPRVVITAPIDGFIAVDDTVAIAGLVNDAVDGGTNPAVLVNGVPASVENGSFVLTGVRLLNGPNSISVVATDVAGNVGQANISVQKITPPSARMTVLSGDGQFGIVGEQLTDDLAIQLLDAQNSPVFGKLVTFEVTRSSGLLSQSAEESPVNMINVNGVRRLTVAADVNGIAKARFQLGSSIGQGNHRVTASALGVAGEVEFCHTATVEEVGAVLPSAGVTQRGAVGQPLSEPMEVLVTDLLGNPVEGIRVTFTIVKGDGFINSSRAEDVLTDFDGKARAMLTLGTNTGANSHRVVATVSELPGASATFEVSAFDVAAPEATTFSGVVLDNALLPIPGALISIPDESGEKVESVTDENGRFLLTNVPIGLIHLKIDPTGSPRPKRFPLMEFETTTIAGIENQLGQPIEIPPVDIASAQLIGGDDDVTLTMAGVSGMSLTVLSRSATFPNGDSEGLMSISQVSGDRVPMPPPNGRLFSSPVWTFQPANVRFDPPVSVQIPNTTGLAPGTEISLFQFDHTIFEYIDIGKATVTEDGLFIRSDKGFGITKSGWGGGGGGPVPPTLQGVTGGNPAVGEPGGPPAEGPPGDDAGDCPPELLEKVERVVSRLEEQERLLLLAEENIGFGVGGLRASGVSIAASLASVGITCPTVATGVGILACGAAVLAVDVSIDSALSSALRLRASIDQSVRSLMLYEANLDLLIEVNKDMLACGAAVEYSSELSQSQLQFRRLRGEIGGAGKVLVARLTLGILPPLQKITLLTGVLPRRVARVFEQKELSFRNVVTGVRASLDALDGLTTDSDE